jgi:hypothetical protein
MLLFEEMITPPLMTVVDIGALLLEGVTDPFARLNKLGRLSVIGFEPQTAECDPNPPLSKMPWSDAVYVPELSRLHRIEPSELLKLAALLHEVYGSLDLCRVVLAAHDQQCATSYAAQYFERIVGPQRKPLVDPVLCSSK